MSEGELNIEHAYICGRCGGGGEFHYLSLPENEEAPDVTLMGEYETCPVVHDEACKLDDADRFQESYNKGDTKGSE